MIKLDIDMTLDELNALRVTASPADDELEHFITCPECHQAIDCRRLGDVLHHDEPGHARLRRH